MVGTTVLEANMEGDGVGECESVGASEFRVSAHALDLTHIG